MFYVFHLFMFYLFFHFSFIFLSLSFSISSSMLNTYIKLSYLSRNIIPSLPQHYLSSAPAMLLPHESTVSHETQQEQVKNYCANIFISRNWSTNYIAKLKLKFKYNLYRKEYSLHRQVEVQLVSQLDQGVLTARQLTAAQHLNNGGNKVRSFSKEWEDMEWKVE